MEIKKIVAVMLAAIMVMTSGAMVFADTTDIVDEIAKKVDFDENSGVVFDGENYYDTLQDAVNGVHGIKGAVLYCKEGADVGSVTHAHVCKDLTVIGNGAYISGGEQDFEFDKRSDNKPCDDGITEDVTLVVDNLTGASAWGARKTSSAINLIFTNCSDMDKVFFYGSTSDGELNISLTNCTFTDNDPISKVYSDVGGKIVLDNVSFTGIAQPFTCKNTTEKVQNITLKNCTFTDCGSADYDYTVPVAVRATKANGTSNLLVDNCTFVGTVANSIGQDADILLDYAEGRTNATILNTNVKVAVETEKNVAEYAEITSDDAVIMDNTSAETKTPVVKAGDLYYATIQAAIDAAAEGDKIVLLGDVEYKNYAYKNNASIDIPSGKKLTIDLNGYTISGENDINGSFAFINISSGANVVIDDTSDEKTGKITFEVTRETPNENNEGYTIRNSGSLTLNGGTIENSTPLTSDGREKSVTVAVNSGSSTGPIASFVMNGGTVISNSYFGVRANVYQGNTSGKEALVINNGTVYGLHFCDWGSSNLDYKVSVGDEAVIEPGNYPDYPGQACRFAIAAKETTNVLVEISENAKVNGTYHGVAASIGAKFYAKLPKALDEAQAGDTITLYKDAVIENAIFNKDITFDLGGKTLTIDAVGVQNNDGPWAAVHSFADVEFKNGSIVVNCKEHIYNGVFYVAPKEDASIKLEDVKLTTEGTNGTDMFVSCAPGTVEIINSEITAKGVNILINGGDKGEVIVSGSKISVSDSARGLQNVALNAENSEIEMKNLSNNALRNVAGAIDNTDITIDGAEFGIKNDDGIKLEIKNDSNVEIKNTTAGDVLTNNTADIVVTDSLLDTENIINVENSVNVGGNEITLPDLDDLYELADGKGEIKVEAKNISTVDGIVVNDGEKAEYFDISVTVDGKEVAVNKEVKVRIKLGAVADGTVAVYHNNVKIGDFTPDSNNVITFTTSSFSPYTLVYKAGEVAVGSETDEITAKIVPTADKAVFDIVLDGNGKKINKFRSAELAIKAELGKGMNYKVVGSGNVQVILPETSGKGNTYEFNLNGTGENYITSDYITLGQIIVSGHGEGTLEILPNSASVDNFVVATVVNTESVQEIFTVGGTDAELELDTDEVEVEIPVLTNSLVVNVEFPNAVVDNDYEYQQMQIRIYGGDIEESEADKYIYKLGADENEMDADGKYSITSTLRQGLIYNVEISGAGYRTYDYQVIMTGNKVLTFWGNLKGGNADEAKSIDAEFPDRLVEWNFLEGDVVMDYTVDIYDLSAVVSYFNRDIQYNPVYAGYDINRDGRIDAVDIGRVLNSWGK